MKVNKCLVVLLNVFVHVFIAFILDRVEHWPLWNLSIPTQILTWVQKQILTWNLTRILKFITIHFVTMKMKLCQSISEICTHRHSWQLGLDVHILEVSLYEQIRMTDFNKLNYIRFCKTKSTNWSWYSLVLWTQGLNLHLVNS